MRAAVPHTKGKVDRNGVNLHYEIYGDGEQTILFLPVWMIANSEIHKGQVPYFSDNYRCITWDPRGNGKSDKPTDVSEFGHDHYVADALAIMDATGFVAQIVLRTCFPLPQTDLVYSLCSGYAKCSEAI